MKKIYVWLGALTLSVGAFAQTTNFSYTGAMQTYTVPAGVTAIRIEVWGAQGQGGNGGQGGYCRGDLAVTPGQVYNIYVGGQAGYNGGGLGWAATPRNGGGASDVRFGGTALNNRIIVAGGGGSSSGDGNYQGGTGGGGTVGPNYAGGGGAVGYGGPGGAGGLSGGTGNTSCHAGGAGGGGFTSGGAPSCNTCYTSTCGQAGSLGQGGNGDTWENGICYNSYGGTSGGGGGYYGGGGSSVGNCGSGGGGGGSSWVGSLSNTVMTGGIRPGNGAAAITVLSTAGACLNFDGVNDYVTMGTSMNATLAIATSLTVEAWVYPTDVDAFGCIVGNYTTSVAGMQFLLRRDGNTFTFWTDRGSGFTSVSTPSIVAYNTWQHVAGVWDGATQTMKIYVNGALQGTTTSVTGTNLTSNTNPVMIGWNTINEQMTGSVDEVRIWTRALCSSEINNNMNCEIATSGTGLLANYHFNQGISAGANSGVTTLNDASGNSYNGTLTNFALTGATSNWLAPGGVVSGSNCSAFTPPAVTVTSASQTDVSCFGGSNGAASVNATGGSGLTYDWSGTPTGDGTASVTGLTAGSYTCTVTNDCGGTGSFVFTITEPAVLTASQGSVVNVSCFGGADGSIAVNANGGVTPYTYTWTPSGSGATATGLTAGSYTCQVTDANGCTATVSATVTEPTALVSSSTSSTILCFGDSASITVSASGGTAPYIGDSISMVVAGTYTYTVTDANGCTSSTSITVTEPAAINVTSIQVDVACNGDSTGSIDLTVTGGTAPYTFDWNSGTYTTEDLTGLAAGTYSGVLTDANGCTSSGTNVITEPTALAVTVTSTTDPSTCGGSDGAIDLSVSGGTPGYSFLWSNSATTEDLNGVMAGIYTCTVSDTNGCSFAVSATLNDPNPPTVSLTITVDTVCADDGSFTLTGGSPAGGTYSGTAVTGGMFDPTSATAGVNTVTYTYTDSSGCSASATDNIYVDACAGLGADLTNASFSIMPNPNNGQFQFVHHGTTPVDVLVYDAIGQLVTSYKVNAGVQQINLDAAGMYTITVVSADGSRSSQRVIVNK